MADPIVPELRTSNIIRQVNGKSASPHLNSTCKLQNNGSFKEELCRSESRQSRLHSPCSESGQLLPRPLQRSQNLAVVVTYATSDSQFDRHRAAIDSHSFILFLPSVASVALK